MVHKNLLCIWEHILYYLFSVKLSEDHEAFQQQSLSTEDCEMPVVDVEECLTTSSTPPLPHLTTSNSPSSLTSPSPSLTSPCSLSPSSTATVSVLPPDEGTLLLVIAAWVGSYYVYTCSPVVRRVCMKIVTVLYYNSQGNTSGFSCITKCTLKRCMNSYTTSTLTSAYTEWRGSVPVHQCGSGWSSGWCSSGTSSCCHCALCYCVSEEKEERACDCINWQCCVWLTNNQDESDRIKNLAER